MKTRRVPVALLLIVTSILAVPLATAAQGMPTVVRAAPVITVTPVINREYPRQVPTAASGRTVPIRFVVSSTEPVAGATATAFTLGTGLVITGANQSLGNLAQPVTLSFDVAGAEPGTHPLFVDVSAPGATPGTTWIQYLWTSGSPLFTGTNPLYGGSYGWQGTQHVAGLESSTRAVRMLTIVSETFAYVGLPANGRPTCTVEGNGCLRYSYDTRSGLLQVGTGIIGHVRMGAYLEGLTPADEQSGELVSGHVFPATDAFTSPRSHLTGTFRYSSPDYPTGLTYEKVKFRKNGSYSLAYAYDGGKVKKLAGRFRLGKHGEITFRSARGKVVQRGTVLTQGRPSACVLHGTCVARDGGPYQRGIWLILSGRKGNHPDGNLLQRLR